MLVCVGASAPAGLAGQFQTLETRDVYMPIFRHLVAIAPEPYRTRIAAKVADLDRQVQEWAAKLSL